MSVVKNLFFSRNSFFLDIPHWEIPDKGISLLQGVSGSGKTTLLKILLGLEEVASLEWVFKGENLIKKKVPDRHIGVVFQDLCLFPHMSGLENIQFASQARGLPLEGKNFDFLKKVFQLDKFLHKKVGLLSGGEAQRVALARALVTQPKILFLDEAFSSLDEELRLQSQELVSVCSQEWDIPVLMISHNSVDLKIVQQRFLLKEDAHGVCNIVVS